MFLVLLLPKEIFDSFGAGLLLLLIRDQGCQAPTGPVLRGGLDGVLRQAPLAVGGPEFGDLPQHVIHKDIHTSRGAFWMGDDGGTLQLKP